LLISSIASPRAKLPNSATKRSLWHAALLDAWRLADLDGKPEGLAFTAQGHAVIGLDTRKPRRNLVLLEPAVIDVGRRD
jgi:hypothetical protein